LILLNELNKIQERDGYISEEEINKISSNMKMKKSELYGVISFYSRLSVKQRGKYIIRVCKSISCGINKSKEIQDVIKDYLQIGIGKTTKDNKFTLELVECLGQCGEAPVVEINNEIYPNMTKEKTIHILKKLSEGDNHE